MIRPRNPHRYYARVRGELPLRCNLPPPAVPRDGCDIDIPFRHVHCRRYDACLEVALVNGWGTWRCRENCPGRDDYGREQLRSDMCGLAEIVAKMYAPESELREMWESIWESDQ